MENLDYLVIELEKLHFLDGELLMFKRVIASFLIESDAKEYCNTLNERNIPCKVFSIKTIKV